MPVQDRFKMSSYNGAGSNTVQIQFKHGSRRFKHGFCFPLTHLCLDRGHHSAPKARHHNTYLSKLDTSGAPTRAHEALAGLG